MRADHLRIPVGPGSLHAERYGHGGTPIVLLHGFGTCAFLWRDVAPALAIARHTAVALDLLGHGESDRPIEADFGVAAQAEYLDRALTVLRIARAVIVGVDLGGGVALRLAATRPDRVAGLVLVNTVAFEHMPGREVRALQRNTARVAFRLSPGMFGASPLLGPVLRGSVADPSHMPDRLVARYLAPFVGRDGLTHLLDLARSMRTEEVEEIDLSCVLAPTLIVWGESDAWIPGDVPTRLLHAIPDSRLARLPGVGRLSAEEVPDRLAALVLEHVTDVDRAVAAAAGRSRGAPPPPAPALPNELGVIRALERTPERGIATEQGPVV